LSQVDTTAVLAHGLRQDLLLFADITIRNVSAYHVLPICLHDNTNRFPNLLSTSMSDTPHRRFADRSAKSPTLIGAGSRFTGNFECGGDLVVAGHIVGDTRVAGSLTIADSGQWEGNISASTAIIAGEVEGDITVSEKLEIRKSARIRGTIRARTIAIATGAVIDGDMSVTSNVPVVHFDEKRTA
jgi:cytoskeletal protein CcmA (bactofilin family)